VARILTSMAGASERSVVLSSVMGVPQPYHDTNPRDRVSRSFQEVSWKLLENLRQARHPVRWNNGHRVLGRRW
jgi:hypothetical protein